MAHQTPGSGHSTQGGLGPVAPAIWRYVLSAFTLVIAIAVVGFMVAVSRGAPLATGFPYIVLPSLILITIVLSGGHRTRLLVLAAALMAVESALVAVVFPVGEAAAVVFPLVGLGLILGTARGRVLRAVYVLEASATVIATALAVTVGPARSAAQVYPPAAGLAILSIFVAGGYAYLWHVQARRAEALAAIAAESAARAVAEGERARLGMAVEQAADMIVVTDAQRVVRYANPAFETITGYTVAEAVGRDLPSLIRSHTQAPDFYEAIDQSIADGVSWSGTLVNRRRDGSHFEFEVTISPLREADGTLIGAVNVGRDRSSEHELARALQISEERFRTLLEKAPTAIGIGRAGRTLFVNGRYLELFGFGPDADVIGRPIGEVFAPPSRAAVEALIRRRARGGGAPTSFEGFGLRQDGTTFPVVVSAAELDLPDGPATVASFMDISEIRRAQADLDLQTLVRTALLDVLHRLQPGASAAEAATAICDALGTLPGVDFVTVSGFAFDDELQSLAHRGPASFPPAHGGPSTRTRAMRAQVEAGPSAQYWQPSPDDGPWGRAFTEMGVKASAFGPIVHGDHVDGMVMLATTDPTFATLLVEHLPQVIDFSTTPSAILAEHLHQHRVDVESRARIDEMLTASAFGMVFQPIVDLATNDVVGHEALSRFANGQPPDEAFADAWRVGLGVELELATLARAVFEARQLPPGRWLDLNVSPELLAVPDRLKAILGRADRPVVVEITEHQAIADYAAIRHLVSGLGPEVRLAVDDAGAGVANFNHIVELGPDLVKLDRSLVRQVNLNLGRQALVIAMSHFAKTAGCRLVAEGIETDEEAATLRELGVEFGQGYLLGRPASVADLAMTPVPLRGARRRVSRSA